MSLPPSTDGLRGSQHPPAPQPSCQPGQGGEGLSALATVPISVISAGWGQGRPAATGQRCPAMRALGQCHRGHRSILVGIVLMGTGAPSRHHDGHRGGTDLPLPEEPRPHRLAGPCRGSAARQRAPAVPRLAAPGTRRCPCVRPCQVPHACLRLVLCAHHTPAPVPGTPCPATRGAQCRGHVWQRGQRAVPCREAAGIPGMHGSWAARARGMPRA